MKSPSATLRQFARKADRIAAQLDELEMRPVAEIARKWRTTEEFIRKTLPIAKLGPKTHRVKLEDAVAFQQRRTEQR